MQCCRAVTDTQLLSHRQAALPDRRVRPAVRGGAGLLGSGREPGGAVLLDDVHDSRTPISILLSRACVWSG